MLDDDVLLCGRDKMSRNWYRKTYPEIVFRTLDRSIITRVSDGERAAARTNGSRAPGTCRTIPMSQRPGSTRFCTFCEKGERRARQVRRTSSGIRSPGSMGRAGSMQKAVVSQDLSPRSRHRRCRALRRTWLARWQRSEPRFFHRFVMPVQPRCCRSGCKSVSALSGARSRRRTTSAREDASRPGKQRLEGHRDDDDALLRGF